MIKKVTRALYVDGNPVDAYTQDPMENSELADIENITAQLEIDKKTKHSADVGCKSGEFGCFVWERLPKTVKFKLKLLQIISKLLLTSREPSVQRHIVCLYIEHNTDNAAMEPTNFAKS